MLPRSRVLSVLLLGLGVTLLVLGLAYPRVSVLGTVVPLDSVDYVIADDNAQLRLVGGELETGPVERTFHVEYTDPKDSDTATVRVGLTLGRPDAATDVDGLWVAEVYSYVLDRQSGSILATPPATVADQLATPPTEVAMADSYWWAFPPDTAGQQYQLWDPLLRDTVTARLHLPTRDEGGRTYQDYVVTVQPTNLAHNYVTAFTEPAPGRALWYEGSRTLTVDRATGIIVNAVENVHLWEAGVNGEDPQDVLVFDGELTEASQSHLRELAAQQTDRGVVNLVSTLVAALGGLLTLLGLVGVIGVFDKLRRKR